VKMVEGAFPSTWRRTRRERGQGLRCFRTKRQASKLRGRFIIDPDGVIQAMEMLTPPVGRKFAESVRQIQAYQHVRATGGKEANTGWLDAGGGDSDARTRLGRQRVEVCGNRR